MPVHALELVPDEAGRALVRAQWQALADAGLPSQLARPGVSDVPHATLVSGPELSQEALDVAIVRVGSLLPVTGRLSGLLLLGSTGSVTIARALELDDDVVRRVLALRVQVPDRRFPGWLPHVTLARRVPRADVPRALEALEAAPADEEIVLSELRRWDPERGRVTVVAQAR
ncbi:hypothetical protein K8Z61_17420 [Nocardioides sp. TRM66260-LWL]|uniref:hypothetical protein n=1 Tax=Nocardioides sp. TRM66260-LWL TaxID=2874478 RepID=UPI001CC478A7|nr:hypothetical protein [Nocardioides sp. TRM66260-LWL]MBZ5736277.1 hypothetical protein [Nocardioides sp. TRM66260-LWL]